MWFKVVVLTFPLLFLCPPLAFGGGGGESVMVFFYLMKSQCYDYDGVFLFALLGVFPSLV